MDKSHDIDVYVYVYVYVYVDKNYKKMIFISILCFLVNLIDSIGLHFCMGMRWAENLSEQ